MAFAQSDLDLYWLHNSQRNFEETSDELQTLESYGMNVQTGTHKPLYNIVRYNTVLAITQFKEVSPKCIDYIEK